MALFKEPFQCKLEKANRVFNSTVEKLKVIQADMSAQMMKNQEKIVKLTKENSELASMRAKVEKQIEEINKFIV